MRRGLAGLHRAPPRVVGERLLLLAVRELEDEDRPATRRVADRLVARLTDLCEALACMEAALPPGPEPRLTAARRLGEARWALAFLRSRGALAPEVHRRIAAGLDVVGRRVAAPSIAASAPREEGG